MKIYQITTLDPPVSFKKHCRSTFEKAISLNDIIEKTLKNVVGGWMFDKYYKNFSLDEKINELASNNIKIKEV